MPCDLPAPGKSDRYDRAGMGGIVRLDRDGSDRGIAQQPDAPDLAGRNRSIAAAAPGSTTR